MKESDIRAPDRLKRYLELVSLDARKLCADKSTFVEVDCACCLTPASQIVLEKDGYSYVQCESCDSIFVNPRPQYESLVKFYRDSPSTQYWVKEFFAPMAEARRRSIFKPRAEDLSRLLPSVKDGLIADIGAGFGLFLEELRVIWPEANLCAIEPSHEMAEICRGKGFKVFESTLAEVEQAKEEFSLLSAYELFEHLYDPVSFLKGAHRLLKPGGYLVLTTLNGLGFDLQVLWQNAKAFFPPVHINFYNPKSLAELLKRIGFEIVLADTPGKLDWDIVEGVHKRQEAVVDRIWQVVSSYASDQAKAELQNWIVKNSLSSHMRVIAQKI